MAEQAHLIFSTRTIVIKCETCPPSDPDRERVSQMGWAATCHDAMDHVNSHPGHIVSVMEQDTAVYSDQYDRLI